MKIFRPSEEDQEAEREDAERHGRLPVTVLHGTHSCSIQCFGSDQKAANEQAEYILKLQEDAERYRWLREVLCGAEASQFLADVVTAAGLLRHGKTDKALAERISTAAYKMRSAVLAPNAIYAFLSARCFSHEASDEKPRR